MVPGLLLPVLLFGLLVPCPASGEEEWRAVGQSKTDTRWYIDDRPVFSPDKEIVSVWVKSVPDNTFHSPAKAEQRIEAVLKDIQKRHFGEYDHTEALWELDCCRGTFRILYFIARDRQGGTVTCSLTPDAPWAPVIPGSVGETLQEELCGRH
jgi:Surface-adhesin protein E